MADHTVDFEKWLKEYRAPLNSKTVSNYMEAVQEAETWLGVKLDIKLLEADSLAECDELIDRILALPNYYEVNKKKGSGRLNAVLGKLHDYWESQEEILTYGSKKSWTLINNQTLLKTVDKSIIDHKGGTVPTEMEWFFGGDRLKAGESFKVEFIDGESSYEASVERENGSKKQDVRIFCKKGFAQMFSGCTVNDNLSLLFIHINDSKYHVEKMTEKDINQFCMKRIRQFISDKGFSYDRGLIENFYLSLKAKPFVILAGTSGTGKTRLVRLFAEAVGATSENGRFKMVSVRPDWSDSSDLFGHVDLNGRFIPGAVIDFISQAQQDIDYPYFLCLDEMNLARVEYYLSDILSVIETRDFNNGSIISDTLISADYYGSDKSAVKKYGKIILPENLYIIGTVNMDETTFPFSKKVLDRANTIEFSEVNLIPDFAFSDEVDCDPIYLNNLFFRSDYLKLKECSDDAQTVSIYCTELQSINRILQKAGCHVGYRVRDEIVFYLLNNKKFGLIDPDDAMDNELMQKILPRIQGSSTAIKEMLCELFKHCAGDYDGYQTQSDDISSKMFRVIESDKCKYRRSAEKIAFMVRRFEEDGFTSYWL